LVHKKIKGKWYLYAKTTGRRLGVFDTLQDLKKRERVIQYYKHRSEG
jgi:hypothetical protein